MTSQNPSLLSLRGGTLAKHRNLITAVLLMIAAWIFYLPSINYGFIYYDDVRILKDHPELYGQKPITADLKEIFVSAYPREEPLLLRDVSWAVDSRIFGFGNPFGYHLGNVLLHGIVVALLFAFLLGTMQRYRIALAATVAFLFLAVHVEPVAWIMGRKDILSALFMLLALCAQIKRLTATGTTRKAAWYGITLLFFLCGLLSKISVLTFPFMLFVFAIFFSYLRGDVKPDSPYSFKTGFWRETALLLPALLITGAVYVWYQRILSQMGIFDRGYSARGLDHIWNLLMVDPMVFWMYLRQIFFPQHLTVLYTWPALSPNYPLWHVAAAFGTVVAIILTGIYFFVRRKDIFPFYAAFFALMVPYINLVFMGIWVADRYVYFSSICILTIAILMAETILRSTSRTIVRVSIMAVICIIAISNLVQKFSYEPKWHDAETLWQYHVSLPHPSPHSYENLAAYYYAVYSRAHAEANETVMTKSLGKMKIVVDAGLEEFWPDRNQPPPPATSFLFFLQSLLQEVEDKPLNALDSLLIADQLKPNFDATNLNLARLYRRLAEDAQESNQKRTYFEKSKERYQKYIELEFHGRPAPPDINKELQQLQDESSNLNLPPKN